MPRLRSGSFRVSIYMNERVSRGLRGRRTGVETHARAQVHSWAAFFIAATAGGLRARAGPEPSGQGAEVRRRLSL